MNFIVRLHKYSQALLCALSPPETCTGSRLQLQTLKMFFNSVISCIFPKTDVCFRFCIPSILCIQREGIVRSTSTPLISKKSHSYPMKEQEIY